MLIVNSSFANNGAESLVANTHIAYDHQLKTMPRVNIVKSNFTLGLGGGMVLFYGNDNEAKIIVENSTFSHNIAQYQGGAVCVALLGVGSIEFNNCTVYNNTVQQFDGGGVYISSHKNGSVVFCDCIIYNNVAQQFYGGGVYIGSNGNSIIEFHNCSIYNNTSKHNGGGIALSGGGTITFHNCTICSNTAQQNGGGVTLSTSQGISIEFHNYIIYNNTAQQYGGGLNIISYDYEIDIIEFSNCKIYNNTVQNFGRGGGVYIDLYKGSGGGSIEFSNCSIYNNKAQHYGAGGGVGVHSAGGDSIEFLKCSIYNNVAQNAGGGVYIDLYEGGGSIDFSNCTIYNNIAQSEGGGVYINLYDGGGTIKLHNCTIHDNAAYLGSGLFLRSLQINSRATFNFKNVLFHFNKARNKLAIYQKVYQSAVVLFNIVNVTFDQIEISNHNTTGLVGVNSQIKFDGHSTFVNNSGIDGGGIALYKSSRLLLKNNVNKTLNISFINNHASESGGGIFASQVLDVDKSIDCSFKVIHHHSYYNPSAVLYFINNTADISGDILYGGNVDNCLNDDEFNNLFIYSQQMGLSVVSSDPIQVCLCFLLEISP